MSAVKTAVDILTGINFTIGLVNSALNAAAIGDEKKADELLEEARKSWTKASDDWKDAK